MLPGLLPLVKGEGLGTRITKYPLKQQAIHKLDIGMHRYCVGSIQFEGVLFIAKFLPPVPIIPFFFKWRR